MDLTLVALAAGVGSRYGGLKQLEPVGPHGEVLLEYSVYDALRAGFQRVVLVVRPETEAQFREAFAGGMGDRVPIAYVHQRLDDLPDGRVPPVGRTKPWGTGHAVLSARVAVDGPFAVVNADDFYGAESYVSLARFLGRTGEGEREIYAAVGFEVGQTLSDSGPVSRGLCRVDHRGYLQEIVEVLEMWKRNGGGVYLGADGEEVTVSGEGVVSMNMWAFTRGFFGELEDRFRDFLQPGSNQAESEFLLPDVVQTLIREERVEVEVLHRAGQWCGITFPQDREKVERIIAAKVEAGEYPENLWG